MQIDVFLKYGGCFGIVSVQSVEDRVDMSRALFAFAKGERHVELGLLNTYDVFVVSSLACGKVMSRDEFHTNCGMAGRNVGKFFTSSWRPGPSTTFEGREEWRCNHVCNFKV